MDHSTSTPTSTRLTALALSVVITLAVLAGIDGLAQPGDAAAQLAQAAQPAAAAPRG